MTHIRPLRTTTSFLVLTWLCLSGCPPSATYDAVSPIDLDEATHDIADASSATRTLLVVAHPDDDLLFMSPWTLAEIDQKHELRIVFMTAGDAGQDANYWMMREQGICSAYAAALNLPNDWIKDQYTLARDTWTRYKLRGRAEDLSIVFLRLPDGNSQGQGWPANQNESLTKLWQGTIANIHRLDTQMPYTRQEIVDTVAFFESDYVGDSSKDSLHLLDCMAPKSHTQDHADHRFSSQFALAAYLSGYSQPKLYFHHGYESADFPENLEASIAERKWNAFLAYAKFDTRTRDSSPKNGLKKFYLNMRQREYFFEVSTSHATQSADYCQVSTP